MERHNQWTFVGEIVLVPRKPRGTRAMVLARCDCGFEAMRDVDHIRSGRSRSCRRCAPVAPPPVQPAGPSSPLWKGSGMLSGQQMASIRRSARVRGLVCEVSAADLWSLFLAQEGRCRYTGLDLVLKARGAQTTASVDRIDPAVGYVVGNVQWVHTVVNYMKQDLTHDEFLEWCRRVVAAAAAPRGQHA